MKDQSSHRSAKTHEPIFRLPVANPNRAPMGFEARIVVNGFGWVKASKPGFVVSPSVMRDGEKLTPSGPKPTGLPRLGALKLKSTLKGA